MENQELEIIHVAPNRVVWNWQVLLLFIPAIVFATLLALIVSKSPRHFAESTTNEEVLGEQQTNQMPQ